MSAWLPEFDDSLVYDEITDTFTTTYDPDAPESFTGIDIDGMRLYPIGNGSWTWTIVDNSAEESASPEDSKQLCIIERHASKVSIEHHPCGQRVQLHHIRERRLLICNNVGETHAPRVHNSVTCRWRKERVRHALIPVCKHKLLICCLIQELLGN